MRPIRLILRVIIAFTIFVIVLGPAATAASSPPLDLQTLLDAKACRDPSRNSGIAVSDEVARGLIAFNTPYLFGGRALRTDLTCGACHGPYAPSGPAALLHFRVPVPDLAGARARSTDVAAFVDHAVVTEFSGPPPPPEIGRSIAALATILAPHTRGGVSDICRIGPAQLVDIGLRLSLDDLRHRAADDADFTIDSTRFILGQMYLSIGGVMQQATMILGANAMLRYASSSLQEGRTVEAARRLGGAASAWESGLALQRQPHITIIEDAP